MKKTLSVLFALLISCITASAQIQNGYVRSQGTSYNRTGSPLKGARVFVKGLNGSKVTAPNGTFNFNLGGGKTQFCISSVTLKGYTLLSPLAPAYNVGKAAVEIVMQSREERIQNEARISKDLEDTFTVESISNKKFLDSSKNKAEAEEKANEEFAKRMRVFLGMDLRESAQNIDGTDLFKLSTTPGFMDVEKQVLQGIKNTTDLSNTIREMFDYSKSLEYTKTAKRIGIILNVSERTKEIDVDPTAVFKYTGEPFEVYYHIQTVNPGEDEYIAVIAAGLKLPTEELKTVYNEYLQRTNNIDKSQDEFLDEIGSLETVSEDKMFNLRKKKKAQSAEDFFGDDDEEDDEISTVLIHDRSLNVHYITILEITVGFNL